MQQIANTAILTVEAERPAIRPSFVLKNHESEDVRVSINDSSVEGAVAIGVERTTDSAQTVITFRHDVEAGSRIGIATDG